MEFILAFILLVPVLAALAYPLVRARRREVFAWHGVETLDDLLAQRDGLYASLRDLEQDLALGKLDAADYERLKARYMTRAAETLQRLDSIRAEVRQSDDTVNQSIEREVLALRGKVKTQGAARRPSASGESPVAKSNGDVAGYCTNCGKSYRAGDKFCSRCGNALT